MRPVSMRYVTRHLAASLLAGLLLAATGPARAADELTVLLDWFVNPDHGPLIVAQELGLYAEHNLAVELIAPADPNDPPKLVRSEEHTSELQSLMRISYA